MLSYIKNYKLNKFLADSLASICPQKRLDMEIVQFGYQKLFNIDVEQGKNNFKTFLNEIYRQKDERIRLKMLLLLHFLLKKDQSYAEIFLSHYSTHFEGNVETYFNKNNFSTFSKQAPNTLKQNISLANCTSASISNSIPFSYSSLDDYIYLQIIIPYHKYLIKLSSCFQIYENCRSSLKRQCIEYECNNCWKIINILKSVSNLKTVLNHLGRYYQDQTQVISDFIEMISQDLITYKTQLDKQIQFAFKWYFQLDKTQLQNLILQVDEALSQNENVFQIFKNKYYDSVEHSLQPNWFVVKEGSLEIIQEYCKGISEYSERSQCDSYQSCVKQSEATSEGSLDIQ